jgi:hypothetical protein
VSWLRTSRDVLERELDRRAPIRLLLTETDFIAGVGAADLLLLHSTDSELLARQLAVAEGPDPT